MGLFSNTPELRVKHEDQEYESVTPYVTYYQGEEMPHMARRGFQYLDWYLALTGKDSNWPLKPSEMCIAGGVFQSIINREEPRDIDIFTSYANFASILRHWRFEEYVSENDSRNAAVVDSNAYVCAGMPQVNVIIVKNARPEAVLDTFDLTVCSCAVNNEAIVWHPDFVEDTLNKRLRFANFTDDPYMTLARFQKYSRKGYYAEPKDLEALADYIHAHEKIPDFDKLIADRKQVRKAVPVAASDPYYDSYGS